MIKRKKTKQNNKKKKKRRQHMRLNKLFPTHNLSESRVLKET